MSLTTTFSTASVYTYNCTFENGSFFKEKIVVVVVWFRFCFQSSSPNGAGYEEPLNIMGKMNGRG